MASRIETYVSAATAQTIAEGDILWYHCFEEHVAGRFKVISVQEGKLVMERYLDGSSPFEFPPGS